MPKIKLAKAVTTSNVITPSNIYSKAVSYAFQYSHHFFNDNIIQYS